MTAPSAAGGAGAEAGELGGVGALVWLDADVEREPFCADVLHVLHDRRLQAESSRGRVCHSVLILIYACSKINMKNTIIAVS